MTNIYFDSAASSPPYPESLTVFQEVSQRHYSNPSSRHPQGVLARKALDESRYKFRMLLGVDECRITATSCVTEANNLVLNSFLSQKGPSRLLVADNLHASSWYATKHKDKVDILRLNGQRNITIDNLQKNLSDQHRLVSIVYVK